MRAEVGNIFLLKNQDCRYFRLCGPRGKIEDINADSYLTGEKLFHTF